MINYLPSFDELYRQGQNIRIHGNRFIQIDMGSRCRIHIWSDIVPRGQDIPSVVHDHDYDFKSTILSGQLVNVLYRVAGTFDKTDYRVKGGEACLDIWNVDRERGLLVKTPKCCVLKVLEVLYYRRGMSYSMYKGQIHATAYLGHAITCIEADDPKKYAIRVFVPQNVDPDNEFRRNKYPEDYLWDVVRGVYRGINQGPVKTGLATEELKE